MTAMTESPADGPARARDLARLHELTEPHLPHSSAPIQQALPHITPDDFTETIAILGRLGDRT